MSSDVLPSPQPTASPSGSAGSFLRHGGPHHSLFVGLLAALLAVLIELAVAAPAFALPPEHYLCDGDPLLAQVDNGAVDAPNLPNTSAGTVPGAFVLLRWRDLSLQLPRTNNAGPPSYSDGQWWWSVEDPAHPRFLHRGGEANSFACARLEGTAPGSAA